MSVSRRRPSCCRTSATYEDASWPPVDRRPPTTSASTPATNGRSRMAILQAHTDGTVETWSFGRSRAAHRLQRVGGRGPRPGRPGGDPVAAVAGDGSPMSRSIPRARSRRRRRLRVALTHRLTDQRGHHQPGRGAQDRRYPPRRASSWCSVDGAEDGAIDLVAGDGVRRLHAGGDAHRRSGDDSHLQTGRPCCTGTGGFGHAGAFLPQIFAWTPAD